MDTLIQIQKTQAEIQFKYRAVDIKYKPNQALQRIAKSVAIFTEQKNTPLLLAAEL